MDPVLEPGKAPEFIPSAEPKWTRLPVRTRPHRNPLASNDDDHPSCPEEVAVKYLPLFYPAPPNSTHHRPSQIEIADIGCAFGGMLFALAPLFPDTNMIGLEIRPKVVAFAQEKTKELRNNSNPQQGHHHYRNLWFSQLNVMKYGSFFFSKGQLSRLFFCHPDPHWKKQNQRRRIISPGLVQEYAFWLKIGGYLYTVSDVPELEEWMISCLDASPSFRRLTSDEMAKDSKILEIATSSSEDAHRASRKGLKSNFAVHVRIPDPIELSLSK